MWNTMLNTNQQSIRNNFIKKSIRNKEQQKMEPSTCIFRVLDLTGVMWPAHLRLAIFLV